MPQHKPHDIAKLSTTGHKFDERGPGLDRCPSCHNEKMSKTPRRKGGPSTFRCRKCSFVVTIDQVFDMHRLLGHVAA